MDKPLVSIITPAYNAGKYIEATVQSALRQTYENIEIIVADDGSKDATGTIVKELGKKDPRVTYVFQENQGQSAARNAALRRARGQYVAFLDADDLFLPSKIEEQVNYLEAHPESGLSYCKIHHFFNEQPDKLYYFDLPHPSGLVFKDLLASNFINPLSVVMRKKILDEYGGFEPTFRRMDEQYLWLKLSYRGVRFDYLDRPLGLYRVHRESLSNEPQYFYETESRFVDLLTMMKTWMTKEEVIQYGMDNRIARCQRRMKIGSLMMRKDMLGRALFTLYTKRRESRMKPVLSS